MFDVVPYDDIIRQGIIGSKSFARQQETVMTMGFIRVSTHG